MIRDIYLLDSISIQLTECQTDLGLRDKAIPDAQLSASSQLDHNHAASQGRLDYEGERWRASAWSSRTKDKSQWLQIDLRSIYIKVTRVATQGRTGTGRKNWQWVTHYMVQFSDDGENFTFFKELGQSAAKVLYIFLTDLLTSCSVTMLDI